MTNPFDPIWEKARRVLLMVEELHRAGYEHLRVFPILTDGPAPRWKCFVVPVDLMSREHGAILPESHMQRYWKLIGRQHTGAAPQSTNPEQSTPATLPFYLNAMALENYPWPGFAMQPLEESAQTFLSHYPDLAAAGRGSDPAYAAWYADVLARTAPGGLMYVHAPGTVCPEPVGKIKALNTPAEVEIPPPPPGEG